MGDFQTDLKLEDRFYDEVFKKWLNNQNFDSIFVRFNSKNIIYETLQKKNDIDIILDNGKENITLSLKTQRKIWKSIFFETVSNCNKGTPGWGYYSKADWIIFSMGDFKDGFICRAFKLPLNINVKKYPKRYSKTFDKKGNILYKTEGRIIPFTDFKYYELFNNRKKSLLY